MAEKRMFTQKIIDSDPFLDMPLSTQALYFHLNMRADDDGFVNSPKRICRGIGASEDDLKLLFAKRFVIGFESGVLVIKHWRMHNTLRKDRYNPTQYQEEYAMLDVKDNRAYTEKPVDALATTWQPNGNQVATQYSIDKISIDKCSLVENSMPESDDSEESPHKPKKAKKPPKKKYGEYGNVLLTENEFDNLANTYGIEVRDKAISFLDAYIEEKGYKSKSHNLAIRRWVIEAIQKQPTQPRQYGRKEVVPKWMNQSETSVERAREDMDRMRRLLNRDKEEEKRSIGSDPELAERAEALQKRLSGG